MMDGGNSVAWPADHIERWQKFTGEQAMHAETGRSFAEMAAERAERMDDVTSRQEAEADRAA